MTDDTGKDVNEVAGELVEKLSMKRVTDEKVLKAQALVEKSKSVALTFDEHVFVQKYLYGRSRDTARKMARVLTNTTGHENNKRFNKIEAEVGNVSKFSVKRAEERANDRKYLEGVFVQYEVDIKVTEAMVSLFRRLLDKATRKQDFSVLDAWLGSEIEHGRKVLSVDEKVARAFGDDVGEE